MPRNGPKFTVEEREQLKIKAWEMSVTGMPQLDISAELDISQATICRWLQERRALQPTPQQLAAAKIREELVCCNIYERLEAFNDGTPEGEASWRALRHSSSYHDICHYGEWAARIAESV